MMMCLIYLVAMIKNASTSSIICLANNVEETKHSMEQDMQWNEAPKNISSSSVISHFCLMARESKVSPTLIPNISHDDNDDDNSEDEDDNDASLFDKGEMVHRALVKNKNACANFLEIFSSFVERKHNIDDLEARLDEFFSREHNYADEIADIKEALEEEQTTKESLEETFALELSKVKETHDRALEVANDFKIKNDELVVAHGRLFEYFEHLGNGSRVIK